MTAIASREADRFIERLSDAVWLVLVHGADQGLVTERARAIVTKSIDDPTDAFALVRLTGADLVADPGRLVDEAGTVGLFGGRRAIWLDLAGRQIGTALDGLLKAPPVKCRIVIEAGALRRDAPLRKNCEQGKFSAAIECAADTRADLDHLIEAAAEAEGLTIDAVTREVLAGHLGADRLGSRSEIDKLMLYCHGKGRIGVEDIDAIIANASVTAVETGIARAFSGDMAGIEAYVRKAQQAEAGTLLILAQRHATLIHQRKSAGEHGGFTPMPPQLRGIFEAQLRLWSAGKALRAVLLLADANARARRDTRLAPVIAVRALWAVARAARAER